MASSGAYVNTAQLIANAVTQIGFAGNSLTEQVSPSTTSTSYVDVPDMTVTLTTSGGILVVIFEGAFTISTVNNGFLALSLDGGSEVAERNFQQSSASDVATVNVMHRFTGVSAASHTIKARWKSSGGATLANVVRQRSLLVMEIKR